MFVYVLSHGYGESHQILDVFTGTDPSWPAAAAQAVEAAQAGALTHARRLAATLPGTRGADVLTWEQSPFGGWVAQPGNREVYRITGKQVDTAPLEPPRPPTRQRRARSRR